MAGHATLAHGLMLKDKWPMLSAVALEARFVLAQESKAAAFKRLLNISPAAFDRHSHVRIVAIGTAHFSFQDRMTMRQLEACPHVKVTLETRFRRFSWIDDGAGAAAGLDVQTPGPVTRLAAHVLGVFTFCLQSRVRGCSKIANNLFVTGRAFLRADKLRTRDAGRSENRSVGGAARQQNYGERDSSPGAPQQAFALTADPSS